MGELMELTGLRKIPGQMKRLFRGGLHYIVNDKGIVPRPFTKVVTGDTQLKVEIKWASLDTVSAAFAPTSAETATSEGAAVTRLRVEKAITFSKSRDFR